MFSKQIVPYQGANNSGLFSFEKPINFPFHVYPLFSILILKHEINSLNSIVTKVALKKFQITKPYF